MLVDIFAYTAETTFLGNHVSAIIKSSDSDKNSIHISSMPVCNHIFYKF